MQGKKLSELRVGKIGENSRTELSEIRQFNCTDPICHKCFHGDVYQDSEINLRTNFRGLNLLQKVPQIESSHFQPRFVHFLHKVCTETFNSKMPKRSSTTTQPSITQAAGKTGAFLGIKP